MRNQKITIGIILVLVILTLGNVSAYKQLCLSYGQSIPSADKPRYTCWHDSCINICVNDNNYPTNPKFCSEMTGCEILGETELDVTPPDLIVNSPVNGFVYNSRKVLFDLQFNEPSSIYWVDNINGRGLWKRICSNCQNTYRTGISFKDGFNNITIKATDTNGNSAEIIRSFFVDSRAPRILKTNPLNGFADGNFHVQFKEENPESLVLYYGSDEKEINLERECHKEKTKVYCETGVDLNKYNGREISYWFTLTDIAGNIDESKTRTLKIDTTFPVVNNPDSFWKQDGRHIYFNLDISENNFDEAVYSYTDDRGRLREKRICSNLKNGICSARKSFAKGNWNLNVQIIDKMGNVIAYPVSFAVN